MSQVQPISIGCKNASDMTGMSWEACLRFARAAGVPITRVGHRTYVIPAAPMKEALQRAAATSSADEHANALAAAKAELALDISAKPKYTK